MITQEEVDKARAEYVLVRGLHSKERRRRNEKDWFWLWLDYLQKREAHKRQERMKALREYNRIRK
jgi:hypothetical protein